MVHLKVLNCTERHCLELLCHFVYQTNSTHFCMYRTYPTLISSCFTNITTQTTVGKKCVPLDDQSRIFVGTIGDYVIVRPECSVEVANSIIHVTSEVRFILLQFVIDI